MSSFQINVGGIEFLIFSHLECVELVEVRGETISILWKGQELQSVARERSPQCLLGVIGSAPMMSCRWRCSRLIKGSVPVSTHVLNDNGSQIYNSLSRCHGTVLKPRCRFSSLNSTAFLVIRSYSENFIETKVKVSCGLSIHCSPCMEKVYNCICDRSNCAYFK